MTGRKGLTLATVNSLLWAQYTFFLQLLFRVLLVATGGGVGFYHLYNHLLNVELPLIIVCLQSNYGDLDAEWGTDLWAIC